VDVHGLDKIFKPQRIALFGANENPKGVGCTVLRNLVGSGFRGVVYPVHPSLEAVQGIHCYPDVGSLPRTPDLAVICSGAATVPELVRQCGEAGILGMVIISAGFRETGPEGMGLERQIREEARRFDGMRIIGPNCLGIIVPHLALNVSFATGMPKPGHVAFISQSGALCTSVLDWAADENVGFSYFVSIGNTLDVDFADLIDYFGEEEETRSILLYVESLTSARKFMTAARAFARQKPIVAYKAGRFPESARAAASHTGAMAGEDAVYEAAFERSGVARVFEIGDIFDCADLVARHQPPQGARLAIVTNAGGPGVMATDALIVRHGVLATLSAETIAHLDESLPPFWSHGNPVDVLGDARPKRFAKATEIVLADSGVDAALVILTPQAMTNPTATAKAIGELATRIHKPILAAWMGGASVREGVGLLNQAGIATYSTPEQAVRAFMTLVAYARNLDILYETPRDIQIAFPPERRTLRERFASIVAGEGEILSESLSKSLLESYGIPVTRPAPAVTSEEAVASAAAIGYPVVLKILSPDITHKTDVGGVALDLEDADSVRSAFERVTQQAARKRPDARIDGVTVQRMVREKDGFELILGVKKDPTFGSVILVGMGGVAAEVFGDRALGFPPLNERLARRMLESLDSWPLLRGHRGRPGVDLDRLIEVLMRFSYLVADYPEITELDVNPLLATPDEAIALDARVIVDRGLLDQPPKPYEHLALRPYPEEYVGTGTLKDGTLVTLRPIKPEDEPLWKGMLASCSPETIYSRFRTLFQWRSHEAATRYCFIDYDREIAIVAEIAIESVRRLLGVGRLVADPDHEAVEYAVLVSDAWQDKGLGGVLTDYCLEIAKHWGLSRIVAETANDNARMLALFGNRGFTLTLRPEGNVVDAAKEIGPK
jgi:acetyltransferase